MKAAPAPANLWKVSNTLMCRTLSFSLKTNEAKEEDSNALARPTLITDMVLTNTQYFENND